MNINEILLYYIVTHKYEKCYKSILSKYKRILYMSNVFNNTIIIDI